MANKIIQFSSSSDSASLKKNLEVYVDIDKDAIQNTNYIEWSDVKLSDYIAYLGTELGTNVSRLSTDISTICPDQQDPNEVLSAFAVVLSSGFDEMHALYEKYTVPYRYRVSKLINVKSVQNSLHQIFHWLPGERIINPEFGSKLKKYLYEGITEQNIEMIVAEIKHCISEWEPRVIVDRVVNVQSLDDTERNTVRIDVVYHIVGLDDEQFRYTYTYHRSAV